MKITLLIKLKGWWCKIKSLFTPKTEVLPATSLKKTIRKKRQYKGYVPDKVQPGNYIKTIHPVSGVKIFHRRTAKMVKP